MAKIFVTGFSCFGSIKCNPTEDLVQELTKCVERQDCKLITFLIMNPLQQNERLMPNSDEFLICYFILFSSLLPLHHSHSADTNSAQDQIIGTKCLEVSAIFVQEWIKQELYPSLEKLQTTDTSVPILVVRLNKHYILSFFHRKNTIYAYFQSVLI